MIRVYSCNLDELSSNLIEYYCKIVIRVNKNVYKERLGFKSGEWLSYFIKLSSKMDQKLKIKYLLIIDTPHRLLQKTTPEYTDPTRI